VIDCMVLFIHAEHEYKPGAPARLDSSQQKQISKDLPCTDFTAEGAMNKNPHIKCVFWGRQHLTRSI